MRSGNRCLGRWRLSEELKSIESCRDGITIEADQRHVSEILKGLGLERSNHRATPRAVEGKNAGNARRDESEGDGDGANRLQMAGDDANYSQAITGGDITKYRALVARISFLSQDASLLFDGKAICA